MEVFFKNLTPEEGAAESLLRDLSVLGENTEEFFRATQGKLAEKSKEKFLNGLERVKADCRSLRTQHGGDDEFASGFPYATMGIAFGLGILMTALLVRKSR